MIPLLFIILVTALSILISVYYSTEVTFFSYYVGAMVGIVLSGICLEIWNRRKRKQEERDSQLPRRKRDDSEEE